jgi:hypothetical protein
MRTIEADLAVLCCIPLTEAEWMERHEQPECGDFVRRNTQERGRGDPTRTWNLFRSEAVFIRRKLDSFVDRGVHVGLNATGDDIAQAAKLATNLAVIAHWKHERVFADDVRAPQALRHLLQAQGHDLPGVPDGGTEADAETLAGYLDRMVLDGQSPLVAIPDNYGDGRLPASILRRERLNELPHLCAGNRVELWDAMVSAAEFSELFGDTFVGTASMQICYSEFLSETFRLRHPDGLCLCTRDTTRAGLNLSKLDAALTLMRARRLQLWRALEEAADIIDSLAG